MPINTNPTLEKQLTITGIPPIATNFENVSNTENSTSVKAIGDFFLSMQNYSTNDPSEPYSFFNQWLVNFNQIQANNSVYTGYKDFRNYNMDSFFNDMFNYLDSQDVFNTFGQPDGDVSDIEDAFRNQYINFLIPDGLNDPSSQDSTLWTELLNTPGIPSLTDQATNAFNYFLQNYPFQNGRLGPISAGIALTDEDSYGQLRENAITDFVGAWYNFIAESFSLGATNSTPSSAPTTTTGTGQIVSYLQAYTNLGFDPSGFLDRFKTFYLETLNSTGNGDPSVGFFNPNLAFSQWQTEIVKDRNDAITQDIQNAINGSPQVFGTVTVDTDPQHKLDVINDILLLLIKMINVIYQVSASQSATLTFFSLWQEKYTDLIQKIPVFLSAGPNPLQGGDSNSTQARGRSELQSYNQGLNENIQATRSALQDDSKSLQANLNQSQDAATQQANIATSILQDLNSILSAIYK